MTDAEKLQTILADAKRELDYAITQRHFVSAMFYDHNDGTYTYDMVHEANQAVYHKTSFFNTVRQIIEDPDEYLKEQAFIENLVKRIEATKKGN